MMTMTNMITMTMMITMIIMITTITAITRNSFSMSKRMNLSQYGGKMKLIYFSYLMEQNYHKHNDFIMLDKSRG